MRQGRTDAWIAHQLEVSASELREFRRRHELSADGEDSAELDLRDEIEAEIEAAALEEEESAEEEDEEVDDVDDLDDAEDADSDADQPADDADADADSESAEDGAAQPRRRRRRRGGRGKRAGAGLQASFDHGEHDGFGLWLDPAVADDPVYSEHWAGKRQVDVTIEPDRIVIVRSATD